MSRRRSILSFGVSGVPVFTCVAPNVRHARDRERRGSADDRGYDSEWRRLRGWHAKREPLCRECYFRGRLNKVEIVNHTVPIRHRPERRLDKSNLSSVCKAHHDTVIRDLEALAESLGDVDLLNLWLADPATRPVGHAYEAKGFPRLLRERREGGNEDRASASQRR